MAGRPRGGTSSRALVATSTTSTTNPRYNEAMVDRNAERRKVVTARFREQIEVTRADVEAAKALALEVLTPCAGRTGQMLVRWMTAKGWPELPASFDAATTLDEIDTFARIASLRFAFAIAVNDLLRHGVLLAIGAPTPSSYSPRVTTWVNMSSTLALTPDLYMIMMPDTVMRTPGRMTELQDPTLYLATFSLPDIHAGIRTAIEQAVACFDAGLHLPCLAMLCTAIEGAWIELGRWLGGKSSDAAQDPNTSLRQKARKVSENIVTAGISKFWKERMAYALDFTFLLQDARNAVHFGVEPTMPNTYEKAAQMLLGAPSHFRTLHDVRDAIPIGDKGD